MTKDEKSIPTWQKANAELEAAEQQQNPLEAGMQYTVVDEMPPIPTRKDAKEFLEHPGTKEATPTDKIRFLELKNVQRADIEALIPEAKAYFLKEDEKERKLVAQEQQSQSPTQSIPVAPVVTYPEFLVKSRRAPPIITTNFVLNTMYATVGTVATMYGLSKYFLNPMHEELSAARHDFFSHAGGKVDEFNNRMSKVVTLPPSKQAKEKDSDSADDMSVVSDASDPTELFHRDIGVQTSPSLSRNQSSTSLQDLDPKATTPMVHQEARLSSITSSIRDLRFSRDMSGNKEKDVGAQLDAFSKYLNDLTFASPYHKYQSNFPTWNNSNSTSTDDDMDKFKNEIRGMKGAMLSTRNFPRSGGA